MSDTGYTPRTGEPLYPVVALETETRTVRKAFTPTTDLNHAKMAWDKLSVEQAMHCASAHAVNIGNGDVGPISAILDPETMRSHAIGGGRRDTMTEPQIVCSKAGKTNECGKCAHSVKHNCAPMWVEYKPHCALSHGMLDVGTGPDCIPTGEETK